MFGKRVEIDRSPSHTPSDAELRQSERDFNHHEAESSPWSGHRETHDERSARRESSDSGDHFSGTS